MELGRAINAVGQALKTGDGVAAQQAYATLQQAIQKINFGGRPPAQVQPHVEEIILNLIQSQANNTPASGTAGSTAPTPTPAPAPTPTSGSGSVTTASTPEIVINLGANSSSSGSTPEVVLNLLAGILAAPGQSSRLTLTTLQARMPRTRPTRKSFSISAAPRQRSLLTLRMVAETGTPWRKSSSI